MATLTHTSSGVLISLENLTLDQIISVVRRGGKVALSSDPGFRQMLQRGRQVLERKLAQGEIVYGVNTGFGGNARCLIPDHELAHHQQALMEFLCCGTGEPLPEDAVRAAILLRANALARGLSGVRVVVIERLLEALNRGITPVVPRFGSVGASGDLCPSAHIARALTGQGGDVFYRGRRMPAIEALQQEGLEPLQLESKEGLALLNGTTVMTGVAANVVDDASYLFRVALGSLAMAVEALLSSPDYFHPIIHLAKHHPGQIAVAEMLNSMLYGSRLAIPLDDIRHRVEQERREAGGAVAAHESIQSPYSLRCIPQGLGPMVETLEQVRTVIEREANSVNDN
ncbi:MAG TPA: aromatic amino acid ammonia-lyase, partial [Bryobacteraceae bacterium]|nr:aromatic amino acid ammonia-lyase [Bryobacteraceae bacterium]